MLGGETLQDQYNQTTQQFEDHLRKMDEPDFATKYLLSSEGASYNREIVDFLNTLMQHPFRDLGSMPFLEKHLKKPGVLERIEAELSTAISESSYDMDVKNQAVYVLGLTYFFNDQTQQAAEQLVQAAVTGHDDAEHALCHILRTGNKETIGVMGKELGKTLGKYEDSLEKWRTSFLLGLAYQYNEQLLQAFKHFTNAAVNMHRGATTHLNTMLLAQGSLKDMFQGLSEKSFYKTVNNLKKMGRKHKNTPKERQLLFIAACVYRLRGLPSKSLMCLKRASFLGHKGARSILGVVIGEAKSYKQKEVEPSVLPTAMPTVLSTVPLDPRPAVESIVSLVPPAQPSAPFFSFALPPVLLPQQQVAPVGPFQAAVLARMAARAATSVSPPR